MDKKFLIVAFAGSIFLIAEFFLLISWYEKDQDVDIFYLGYEEGYKEGIISIFNKTENCHTVPIFVNNQTKNLIDLSCANLDEIDP